MPAQNSRGGEGASEDGGPKAEGGRPHKHGSGSESRRSEAHVDLVLGIELHGSAVHPAVELSKGDETSGGGDTTDDRGEVNRSEVNAVESRDIRRVDVVSDGSSRGGNTDKGVEGGNGLRETRGLDLLSNDGSSDCDKRSDELI